MDDLFYRAKLLLIAVLWCLIVFCPALNSYSAPNSEPHWIEWNSSVFEQAKQEKKLVLLDLEAVWCHWCHVMHEETYGNTDIQSTLAKSFLLVRADQDQHLDLSARYQDYGWPATIIFNAEGKELRKLAGFIEPSEMQAVLADVIANPVPKDIEKEVIGIEASLATLDRAVSEKLLARHYSTIDLQVGGLDTAHRYLDPDSIEFALRSAAKGSEKDADWVKLTLDQNLKLMDPVWGGVYQYSTNAGWNNPHFEKIVSSQATNIRLYSIAFGIFKDSKYLDAAKRIAEFINTFLTDPEGAFYTSQDADLQPGKHAAEYFTLNDTERRSLGLPRIDTNIYPRENGELIESLSWLYSVTGDRKYLDRATSSAKWIYAHRNISQGGFRHTDNSGDPFLSDNLWMARASLALYEVTADRSYFENAKETLKFIDAHFTDSHEGGYYSTSPVAKGAIRPVRQIAENIALARTAALFAEYSGDQQFHVMAERAFAFIGTPEIALYSVTEPGVLLAAQEISGQPTHVAILGSKSDSTAGAMFLVALTLPNVYRRVEWWDREQGALPNPDVQYPKLPRAAAFLCVNRRCSLPIFSEDELKKRLTEIDQVKEVK